MPITLPQQSLGYTVIQNGCFHPYYCNVLTRQQTSLVGPTALAGLAITPPPGPSDFYTFFAYRAFVSFTIPAGMGLVGAALTGVCLAQNNFVGQMPSLFTFPAPPPWQDDTSAPRATVAPTASGPFTISFPPALTALMDTSLSSVPVTVSLCLATTAEAGLLEPPLPGNGQQVWGQLYQLSNLALVLYAARTVNLTDNVDVTDEVSPHLTATYQLQDQVRASDSLTHVLTHSATMHDRGGASDQVHMVRTLTLVDEVGVQDAAFAPSPDRKPQAVTIPVFLPARHVAIVRP